MSMEKNLKENKVPEEIKKFAVGKTLHAIRCLPDGSCIRIYFADGTFISIVTTWASWEGGTVSFDIGTFDIGEW